MQSRLKSLIPALYHCDKPTDSVQGTTRISAAACSIAVCRSNDQCPAEKQPPHCAESNIQAVRVRMEKHAGCRVFSWGCGVAGGLGSANEWPPCQTGPGSALDQVPLPVDVSMGLTLREETLRPGNGLPLQRQSSGGSTALTTFICLSERLWSAA